MKHLMLLTTLASLSLVATGLSQAPVKDKVTPVPRDDVQKPKIEFLNLSIQQFYANRNAGGGILVGAFIVNKNKQTVAESPYSIYQSKGTGWTRIKSGTLKAVLANGSVFESVNVPASYDAMKFKIEVSRSVQGTVECALPQLTPPPPKVLVVKYRCLEWQQEYFRHGNNELVGERARGFQKVLTGLGFETKIEYQSSTFSTTYRQWVHYRLADWREKTFETRTAAINFHSSLPNGATREIVER
jgi:hypothetical protein